MSYNDDVDDDIMNGDDDDDEEEGLEEEEEELPPVVTDLAEASVPDSLKDIRACMRCGILKTLQQFYSDGCDNCPFLDIANRDERLNTCTTAFYDGQVAVMNPRESWTAKWLRINTYLPGVYAISVTGQFPKDIEEELERGGRRWRCTAVVPGK